MVRFESKWGQLPKWRRALAVLAFVTSGLLALGLVLMFLEEAQVREQGVRVTAEVIGLDRNHRSPDYANVRFLTIHGDSVVANIELVAQGGPVEVGDAIEVNYDPKEPTETAVVAEVQAAWYWLNIALWFPLLVSIPVVFGGWAGGVSVRRRSKPAER